jgi:hypothetical protein
MTLHALTVSALMLASGLAPAQPSPAPMATATPNDAVRGFYAVYLAWRNWGVPPAASRNPFTPVVSAGLAADLAAAGLAAERGATGGLPPGWPGDLFTSLPDGAQRADVGTCTRGGEAARCDVTLTVRDPASGIDRRWHDTALVRRERGSWVVDDVVYGGRWPGANSGTLRANLKAFSVPPAPPMSMPPPATAAPRR